MGSTHATPSVAIHANPGRVGAVAGMLAGLVIGAGMTFGGLIVAGRIDFESPRMAGAAAAPAADVLYVAHVQREHRPAIGGAAPALRQTEPRFLVSEGKLAQVRREYRSDMAVATEAATWTHVQREYSLELVGWTSSATMTEAGRRHFLREHRSEAP